MTENSSNRSKQSGNTKQIAPAKNWCFTFNNYTEDDYQYIIEAFEKNSSKYIIGKEVGEKGTPHLQGYVYNKKKFRPSELKLSKSIHWEKCKGSQKQNIEYCMKDSNYKSNIKIEKPLKLLQETQLYDWQKDIIKIIKEEPHERIIYWYWEPTGNCGKTTFAKYLSAKFDAVPIEGKKNDILYCAAEHNSDIYIFDFERCMEEFISYGAMEKIKNGYYMCSKYESKPIIRNCPHIICFANFEPDVTKLSADRWKITEINNKKNNISNKKSIKNKEKKEIETLNELFN